MNQLRWWYSAAGCINFNATNYWVAASTALRLGGRSTRSGSAYRIHTTED